MRTRWLFASLMAIGFFLVFLGAHAPSLDSDGVHYAAVAKTIARSGRWLLPYDPMVDGHYYFHLHGSVWPTAFIFQHFGISPFTAKLYSIGMTLAALVGIFAMGTLLAGSWAGWCAGMIFLGTNHVLRITRQCRVDLPLISYVVWAYLGLMLAQTRSKAWYLLAGLASLGAVMTKEIVGLVPLCTGAAYLVLRRKWRELFHPAFLAAWVIALGPPLWLTWMEQKRYQATLWRNYFQQNFLFLAQAKQLAQPWTYYLWAVWAKHGYLLPLILPGAWYAGREIRSGREPRWLLVFLWVLAFPIGFSLSSHKLYYYILPIYAGTALWVGLTGERWIAVRWRPRVVAGTLCLAGLAAVLLNVLPIPLYRPRFEKNVQIAPSIDAILRQSPGEVIVVRQDVASLLFYCQAADRITTAHHEHVIREKFKTTADHRRYCLIGYADWALLKPEIRARWKMLLDDGERYFLVENPKH